MDLLDDYVSRSRSSIEYAILDAVDEYSLYCFYLGFQPDLRATYRSPIRDIDNNPSWRFFENRKEGYEYKWKDNGLRLVGDIFDLVKILYSLGSRKEACARISEDFELDLTREKVNNERVVLYKKPDKGDPTKIAVQSMPFSVQGLNYWLDYGITEDTLKLYRVTQIKYYWTTTTQDVPSDPYGLGFAYSMMGKYKLYFPQRSAYRFLNDLEPHHIEGFAQLTYKQPLLFITKSLKDVMVLRECGYDAVSPRSESTLMPYEYFTYFDKKYPKVLVLFDNDMKHNGDKYPYPKIYIPLDSGCKDISDYAKKYGLEETKKLIETWLN